MYIDTDAAHLTTRRAREHFASLPSNKIVVRISSGSPYFSLYNCHISSACKLGEYLYICSGRTHSGRIKGWDDKGGHKGRWICNKFIAVVKIPKVTKESGLTYAIKTAQKKEKGFLVRNNAPRRESGGWVSYPADRDKSVSCFTE